jgi:hypothetical protein
VTTLTTLGRLLPLIVFLLSAGLTVFARVRKWMIPESAAPTDEAPPPATEARVPFLTRYRWEIILAAAVAAILLFAVIFAPPRLTRKIPPEPYMPGRPFFSLHWEREFLTAHSDAIAAWSNILASLLCLVVMIAAIKRRSRLHTETALLLSSLTLAMLAQWTLTDDKIIRIGAALYIVAVFGFIYWAWLARPRLAQQLQPESGKPVWEIPLVVALLALTTFARFYALGAVPYGIEGDEAKWTSEAINLGILGTPDLTGEYHRDALPVSFYLQTPFHRLLGASLISARVTVAFLSVLASLIFYWLLRRIAPVPLAALATYLLSVSIFDISASRLANVESFVKLWAVLPIALLAFALEKRVWPAFALTGLALAIAALTYDTLWPIIGVCLVLTVIELWKSPAQEKLQSLAALLAPVLLTLPVIVPYFISRVSYYELGKKGWEDGWLVVLGRNFVSVLESWFVSLRPDFLYNRVGPLLNAALLPWLAAGVVAALVTVRARSARWLLVWMGLVILPVPILTNSPLGRVYYPGLPAIYGLIAIGLFLFWKEIQRVLAPSLKSLLLALMIVPLVWLPLTNFYIYFNEVSEPDDRQMRREISEIASTVTDDRTLLMLSVVPNADEPLNNEYQMIELFLTNHLTSEQARRAYERVALDKVMPTIADKFADWTKLIIVLDRKSPGAKEQRVALTEGLAYCFPRGQLLEGRYFDQFILDAGAYREAKCLPVTLTLNAENTSRLTWNVSAGKASSVTLLCERQRQNYVWLEAEEIPLGAGWQIEINFAPGWNGSGFVMDNYGSQFLSYDFGSPFSGQDAYVWARTYKRVTDNSPAYINVNDTTLPFGHTPEELLNEWVWERIGPFPNEEIIRITIARPYNENLQKYMALFMDAFIFTDDPTFNPEADLTESMPPQFFPLSSAASSGSVQPNLPSGKYTCHIQIDSQQPLVDAFGRLPVSSNTVEVSIP